MNPEGESIKPGDEDENGSKDVDTKDIDSDKTEGDENEVEQKSRSLSPSAAADKVRWKVSQFSN
jgi:hypothetical protein